MAVQPTGEQEDARGLFATGMNMAIEAGAGTGKSSTLVMLAEDRPLGRGRYVVFNRAAALDAQRRFPSWVACSTINSVAARATDRALLNRLDSPRVPSWRTAQILGISKSAVFSVDGNTRMLTPSWLAGYVTRALRTFCYSADPHPTARHFDPVAAVDKPGETVNNDDLADNMLPALERAWADVQHPDGKLRYTHDVCLKAWALGDASLNCDFLLADECFPPGTKVATDRGLVAIEDIAAAPNEPWRVLASSDGGRTVHWSDVTSAYATPHDGPLVRITHEAGFLTCTANHPLWVEGTGWVQAGLVGEGDTLRYLRRTDRLSGADVRPGVRGQTVTDAHDTGGGGGTSSKDLRSHEGHQARDPEPYGRPHHTGEGVCVDDGPPVLEARRQRARANGMRAAAVRGADKTLRRLALAPRSCRRAWTVAAGPADELQDRPGGSIVDGGDRGRRSIAQAAGEAGARPEEGQGLDRARVVGVEVLERRGANRRGRDGDAAAGGSVYTLAVEAGSYIADGVLVKNCQDLSAVQIDVFARQPLQVAWTGDSSQQVYSWRGAQNALAKVPTDLRTYLTRSFRFGPPIADLANRVLALLPTELRLSGTPTIDSAVAPVPTPDAVLTRTNAVAVERVIRYQERGVPVHLVGGGGEVLTFANAALRLQQDGRCDHPELGCFDSWRAVQAYVADDPLGDELRLMVDLVDKFGADVIIEALDDCYAEDQADVVVSTAHKAKGREWNRVQLASDFPELADCDDEEFRLFYVAVTRARFVVDPFHTPLYHKL